MEKINLICVYDLLKKNYPRHHLLKSCNYVGEFTSQPIYDLYYDVNQNNVRLIDGNTSINFEVYEIDDKVIKTLNFSYSAHKEAEIRLHSLNKIETPYGDALTFYNNVKLGSALNVLTNEQIKSFFKKNKIVNETTKI